MNEIKTKTLHTSTVSVCIEFLADKWDIRFNNCKREVAQLVVKRWKITTAGTISTELIIIKLVNTKYFNYNLTQGLWFLCTIQGVTR